ncbi:hypothetical protein RD792_007379 [Penstemon davidsonii]|uniref:Wax synthase domain-containing protein n=1 Tax=Penstemon davidsonii TaxID=160366 RepID=A0ABR0D6B1_9LAMI|nr:hypothetical protein RD792_007379 [Penstemon davidsonii]
MANSHRIPHFLPPDRRPNPKRRHQTPLPAPRSLPLHHPPSPSNFHPSRRLHHLLPRLARQFQTPPLLFQPRPSLLNPTLIPLPFHLNRTPPHQNQKDFIHPYLILVLYCCHVYLGAELIFAVSAAPARAVFGLDLEPQFDEPYLATSLQDFWGRRWNLMVTSILRPAVYLPVRSICTRILGRRWALPAAIFATFLVSGLMHELIYYYLTRVDPTWEVTWFFVLHGVCVAVEVAMKKVLSGRLRMHRAVSGVLTLGFLVVTGGWLFFPQLIRNEMDLKAINEYSILVTPDIDYHSNSMLLDDVGNCVPGSDEPPDCSHFE